MAASVPAVILENIIETVVFILGKAVKLLLKAVF